MRTFPHLLAWCLLCSATSSFATTQIYRYKDDAGTLTFTTDLQSIPELYRRRAVPLYTEITSTTTAVTPAEPQPLTQVVTVGSDYRMGDHDTRTDAIRMAIESAKRQALEQVATYLESITEVRDLDVTRDELRSYSAGMIMVLDQQTSTRTEDGVDVIHVDLTAQVDRNEVVQAITALRENESAKNELVSLRTETEELRRQLDAANQALATAESPEQIQALAAERQQILNQMQADALVSQAWTDWLYTSPAIYAYWGIGFRQVNGLLLRARQLHPTNRHLHAFQQAVAGRGGALSPPTGGGSIPIPPRTTLLVPHRTHSQGIQPRGSTTSPLKPTFPQIQPLGVPHGSLGIPQASRSQTRAIPTFPQIQPLGVPHGSLSRAPSIGHHHSGHTSGHVSGGSRGGGRGR